VSTTFSPNFTFTLNLHCILQLTVDQINFLCLSIITVIHQRNCFSASMASADVGTIGDAHSDSNVACDTNTQKKRYGLPTPVVPPPPFSYVIARSNPLFEAQFNAPRIREEMMPASLDVTFDTTAEGFFGTDYIVKNGQEYTRHLTRWIAQLNSHHISSYASQFIQAHLTRNSAEDPKNCRAFVDMIYLSVDQVFTQVQIDEQGTYGVKFLEGVLKHLKQALSLTEKVQVEKCQALEPQRQAEEQAEQMQLTQTEINPTAQQDSQEQGHNIAPSAEVSASRACSPKQSNGMASESSGNKSNLIVCSFAEKIAISAAQANSPTQAEAFQTGPHHEPRRIASEDMHYKVTPRGGQHCAPGTQSDFSPAQKYNTIAARRGSPFASMAVSTLRGHGQKLQDAFIPPSPNAFQNQPSVAHTRDSLPLRRGGPSSPNGKNRFNHKEQHGFHQLAQERFLYAQGMTHIQYPNTEPQFLSPVPHGIVPTVIPGGRRPQMLYDPSMHAMIPQGAPPGFAPDVVMHMPQGYANFKIPVQPLNGRGISPSAEGFMQQSQSSYVGVNQPPNFRYGRGGMGSKGGRGNRGGRHSVSGNNLNVCREHLGSSRGAFNGLLIRQTSFKTSPSHLDRRDGSYEHESHKLPVLPHSTERFPDYIDRGYVEPDSGYIPHDELPFNEKCFKKSIGSDVETMTSLWIGSIAPGTTVDYLRKMLEEKVTVSYIRDLEADERSIASWTFAE
jgi:hypothetical protein